MTIKTLLCGSAVVLLFLGSTLSPANGDRAIEPSVKTVQAEVLQTQGEITVSGVVTPKENAIISARISGFVTEIDVNAGNTVKAGQRLLTIDTKELVEAEIGAKAALESAKADLDNAKRDLDRYGPLLESKAISKQQYDEITRKYEVGQATYQRAQSALDQARIQLSYGDVAAPYDGVIADRTVNVGDFVQPGRRLLTMYAPGSLELAAPVAEQYARYIQEGTKVTAHIPSLELTKSTYIREVVPQTSDQTKSILVKAPLPDVQTLLPGVYGTLTFATVSSKVIAVPADAVQSYGQLEIVKVLRNGRIDARYVRTGKQLPDNRVEVLSGLEPGESVVVE